MFTVNTKDSTVTMTTVTEGPSAGALTSITAGLQVGDVVVTDGSDRLRDGASVQLPGAKPAAPGAAAPAAAGAGGAQGQRGAALAKACGADMQKFCASAQGPARFQCLRDHKGDLSQTCQDALSKMRRGGGGGGNRGGGFGGGP